MPHRPLFSSLLVLVAPALASRHPRARISGPTGCSQFGANRATVELSDVGQPIAFAACDRT